MKMPGGSSAGHFRSGGVLFLVVIVIAIAHHMVDGDMVPAAEAVTVGLTLIRRKVRMTVLVSVVHIGTTVIIEVFAGAFDTILESLPAELIEFIWGSVPGTFRGTHTPVGRTRQVRHTNVVSATEALAVGAPHLGWNIGTAIFIPIVDVGTAVIVEVLVSPLDPIVKAATLYIVPGVRRPLPVVAILADSGGLGC